MKNLRTYPIEFLEVPESFESAQSPPSEEELAHALEIRRKFLFPKDKTPYMVDILRAFRLLRGAKRYVEIGTYDKGNLAYASQILGEGAHIIDVDIIDHAEKRAMLKMTVSKNQRLTSIVGDSTELSTVDKVHQALEGEKADLIFIDGNHIADIVMADYTHYAPLVKPGGFIFFHDIYWYGDRDNFGACHAIAEIDRLSPVYVVLMDHPVHRFLPWLRKTEPVWGGIGMIQKPF